MPQNIQWTTRNPGLIIILVDRTNIASCVNVTDICNKIISEIINLCFDGKNPKDRCFITVIGYDSEVKILVSGSLQKLEANPLRIDEVTKKVPDGVGGLVDIKSKMPVWIEQEFSTTIGRDMYGAFEFSYKIIQERIKQYPERPAPIILNIVAGLPCDSFSDYSESMSKVLDIVESIKKLSIKTNDEKIQVVNILVEDNSNKVIFPLETSIFSQEQDFLYRVSTELSDIQGIYEAARYEQLVLDGGTHSFVHNIDKDDICKLVKLIFNYKWLLYGKMNEERFNN